MKKIIILLCTLIIFSQPSYSRECKLPKNWQSLSSILEHRVNQRESKMKLSEKTVIQFECFLASTDLELTQLQPLQSVLPKTTIELLMSIKFREVSANEAEAIAQYLKKMTHSCDFKNIKDFDNNTSHIVGREWHEIDYAGEGMTWQKQKAKYARYNISNFKTLDNIQKFFPVEPKLPYFTKTYGSVSCKF